jgi:hypothetical protein
MLTQELGVFFCQVYIVIHCIYDPTGIRQNYLLLDVCIQRNIYTNTNIIQFYNASPSTIEFMLWHQVRLCISCLPEDGNSYYLKHVREVIIYEG